MDTQPPGEREHEGYPPGSTARLNPGGCPEPGHPVSHFVTGSRSGEAHTAAWVVTEFGSSASGAAHNRVFCALKWAAA